MVAAEKIVSGAIAIYNEKCGYIWGGNGQTWTEAKQKAVEKDPNGREQTKKWGRQWIGKRVFDCSGLWYYLMEQNGGYVYHGSDTIWHKYCKSKGKLKDGRKANGEELKPGTAVFLYRESDKNRHHIGVYIGNGEVIEAKGTYYGVVKSSVLAWHEWGEIKNVKFPTPEDIDKKKVSSLPKITKGSKATIPATKMLQTILYITGDYTYDVTGTFDAKTTAAVKAFQKKAKITVDGIVGPVTWAALLTRIRAGYKGG